MKKSKYFIVIILILSFLSCSKKYYSNYIIENYSTGFFNTDYDVFVKFPGDYVITDSIKKIKTLHLTPIEKKLSKLIKKHFKKNIVFIGKTIESPYYKTIGIFENKKSSISNHILFKKNLQDSLFIQKEQLVIDSNLYFSLYHITSSKTFRNTSFEPSHKIIPHQDYEFNNIIQTLKKIKFDSNKLHRVNYTKIKQLLKKGLYLNALNNLNEDYNTYDFLGLNENSYNQAFSILYSFINEYDRLYDFPIFRRTSKKTQLKTLNTVNFYSVNALDYLDSIAKTEKYIMINEMHHYPKNRVFTNQFIDILVQNGFKHILIEGVFYDTLINKRKYPTFSTGFYTMEPEYGNLLRNITQSNLIIHSYEDTISYKLKHKNFNSRDSIQAYNIKKIINQFPKDKFLIYTGYNHINKKSNGKMKRLGQYLVENGLDIYSISQDKMNSLRNYTEYDSIMFKFKQTEPFILLDKNILNPFSINPSKYDLEIFYPHEYNNKWCLKNKKPIIIDLKNSTNLKKDQLYLIQVFDSNMKSNSVPMVNKIIKPQNEITLFIPQFINQYYVVLKNHYDSIIYQSKLNIL